MAKILTSQAAAAERRQASRTDERLRRYDTPFTVPVPELVPIDGERAALVLPDLGRTLAEDSRLLPPFDTVTGLLDSLLAAGVSWRGFAPRNLCPAQGPGEYTLIDLEHASFLDGDGGPRGIHVLTVLFWALDWCPVGEDPLDVEARLLDVLGRHGLTTVTGEADAYERCFAEVTGHALDRARQLVREATIRSWRPLGPGQQGGRCFSPSELCQLCDELLPLEHAVLTTQTLARLREDLGEDGYADLLGRLEATLCAVLAEAGAASSTRLDLARVCAELDTSVGALLARSGQRTAPDGDNWFLLARSCAAT
ncbi:hypothetical protein [Streptomyces sp. NPDC021224]|uniref:hypothetical protein n=1 Tax=unclassified Streptomyces TaxID=2593676 RepID=UPI0037926064